MAYDEEEDYQDGYQEDADMDALRITFFENILKDPIGAEFISGLLSITGVTSHGLLQDTERKQCYQQGKSFVGGHILNRLKTYAPKQLYSLLIGVNIPQDKN